MKSCRIIVGKKGEGKTTKMGDEYYLYNISTKKKELLLSHRAIFVDKWRVWYYNKDAFERANSYLINLSPSSCVFIDEVGRMEMEGIGFYSGLCNLIKKDVDLTISLRDELLSDILKLFHIVNYHLIRL